MQSAWKLDPGEADAVSKTVLEQGYASHSRKAIKKLLPRLTAGEQYATIRREIFPDQFEATEPLEALPPVHDAPGLEQVKNPSVMRTLSEVRKVVNAIVGSTAGHSKAASSRLIRPGRRFNRTFQRGVRPGMAWKSAYVIRGHWRRSASFGIPVRIPMHGSWFADRLVNLHSRWKELTAPRASKQLQLFSDV